MLPGETDDQPFNGLRKIYQTVTRASGAPNEQINRYRYGLFGILNNLLAPVEAIRGYVVTQMSLAGGGVGGKSLRRQGVVGAPHAALGRRFSVLLDRHVNLLKSYRPLVGCR